jgi:F-type H+-transporting ATPase subunit gamma
MGNQKEIRNRIGSTKKTKKITSAMKLVAAAKVNKMQKKLQQTRPFANKIKELFAGFQNSLSKDFIEQYPLLKEREVKTVLLLVIGADRGLCGAYNTNVIKAAVKRIRELQSENKAVKLITVGRKPTTALGKASWQAENVSIAKSFCNLQSIPTIQEATLITEAVNKLYMEENVDKVELISTKFINMVSSEVELQNFLPVDMQHILKNHQAGKAEPYVIFDPDAESLINTLLPMYLENTVYERLTEAVTSELASRMTAMGNATSNAEDVIKRLVLAYNKARQASITQEISEIVGGAAAI